MATFTMDLHELLGVDTPRDADASRIGLDDYPIWDQGYRDTLNQKIVMRFWNREIGFETPQMFVHNMRTLMGEIMPYYSELAKTTVLDFDPFETINVETEHDAESDSTTTGTTEAASETRSTESGSSEQTTKADNSSRSVNSDHPQTRLNEFEDYATSSADAVSSSVSESDGTSTGEQSQDAKQTGSTQGDQSPRHRDRSTQRGTQGNKSQLLQQYRDTIMGVDVLILEELEVLFMGVWDTDQAYTRIESPHPYMMF